MPIHDWSRVNRAWFHSFYLDWTSRISGKLNNGVLPSNHFAMCETIRDGQRSQFVDLPEPEGKPRKPECYRESCSRSDSPPLTRFHAESAYPEYAEKVITIRRSDTHGVVAAIRIVAADTKRSRYRLSAFIGWAVEVLRDNISLLLVDLFPPGPLDPQGIHKAIWDEFMDSDFALPANQPLTLASYVNGYCPEVFIEPTAVGTTLTDMPLFLTQQEYVPVPLEATYQMAWNACPQMMRQAVETGNMPDPEAE